MAKEFSPSEEVNDSAGTVADQVVRTLNFDCNICTCVWSHIPQMVRISLYLCKINVHVCKVICRIRKLQSKA